MADADLLQLPTARQSDLDLPISSNASQRSKTEVDRGTIVSKEEDRFDSRTIKDEEDVRRPEDDDFPDGGLRAWLVVFGSMCSCISTFGYVNSWGVFQSYYTEHLLKDESPSNIAWIGSMQYALIFLPALVLGRLFDIGYHKGPMGFASVLLVVSTILVAECTKYWQFFLAQGLAVGLACGFLFGPLNACVSHYFLKKRGLALGLVAVGSSIGGTVFPIVVRNLIGSVGFPWTMRILAFILILTTGTAFLTIRRRLEPRVSEGGLLNLKAFKYAPFTIYSWSSFVAFLGLYTVLTFIDVSALEHGVSPEFSFYLIAIANGASGFGRLFGGLLSDKIGPGNVMIPFTTASAVLTFAWPFAKNTGSLVAIAIIYGLCVGSYVSLTAVPVIAMGEMHDAGRRIGMFLTILSLGALVGPPISGAINKATDGYEAVGYYAGSTILVAIALMIWARQLIVGKVWAKF
jgi:MCP family monocarboxylic acid transporter-like MFS transporter 10